MVDLWSLRLSQNSDDDESFLSCSDSESDSDVFFTPPQSPAKFDSDDEDLMIFEESLESFEDEKLFFKLFIEG